MPRLNVGLIGLGRLGRVYARDLAGRIPEARLAAVADPAGTVAEDVAAEFDVPRAYSDPLALIDDSGVDAIVIVTPTHIHREQVIAAATRRKPTFCEKPPALSLAEVAEMKAAIERSGMFFQMGFMRRFDVGYAAAKKHIAEGRIGMPLVFKATSRDPFRPSLEYANPKSSGGMLIDMGIHDFDLARWFMGEVRTVAAIGATIAYPSSTASATSTTRSPASRSRAASSASWISRAAAFTATTSQRKSSASKAPSASATCARRRS
jgi:predicted dehydrogenase